MSIFRRTWLILSVVACFLGAGVMVAGSLANRRGSDQPAEPPPEEQTAQTDAVTQTSTVSRTATEPSPDTVSEKAPKTLFEELTPQATGVDFVHRLLPEHPLAYLYHSGFQCGGVCLGDVDGDGLADIFLVSGPDENALFINRGNLRFEKSPASAQLAGGGAWGTGATMSDVDGDGDLDVFVCNYGSPNCLWLNEGNDAAGHLRFTEAASIAGVAYEGPSLCPYFADLDTDGDLDLFLLTNRFYSPTGRPAEVASELGPDGQPRVKEEYAPYLRVVDPQREMPGGPFAKTPGKFLLEYGYDDRVYRNDGVASDGRVRFTDVTAASGLGDVPGHGLSALIWDVNHDDRPDIYVANDYSDPDRLWLNQGPDATGVVTFRDATDEFLPYTTWFSMGSDVADVNGDGRLDFLVADMAATTHYKAKTTMGEMSGWRRWVLENAWPRQAMRNMLFVDSGAGRFRESAYIAGVASSDWTWAVKFADFDLDGRNDLFLANGTARMFSDSDIYVRPEMLVGQTEWDVFRDTPEMRERNIVFRNVDGKHFEDASDPWNLGKVGMSFASATGDLDGDGDLDLVVCNLTENVSIYRNHATTGGRKWLRVKLEDRSDDSRNRSAFGALVTLTFADGTQQIRLMNPQTGFLSANEPVLHFGLGDRTDIEGVTVRWLGGAVQRLGPQKPNQLLVIRKRGRDSFSPVEKEPRPLFAEMAGELGLTYTHREVPYDDFQKEFLLPGKLSQFGPGVAVADLNGDGREEVFVGGAAGQAAALFVSGDYRPRLPREENPFRALGGSAAERQATQPGYRRLQGPPWDADAQGEDMGVLFFDADRDGDLDLYVARGSNQWDAGDARYQDGLYLNVSEPGEAGVEVRFAKAPPGALPAMRESASCVVGCDFDLDGDVDLFVGARSVPGSYPLTPTSTLLMNDSTGPGDVRFRRRTETLAPGLAQAGLVTGGLASDVNGDGWSDLLLACEWGPVRLFKNEQGRLVDATEAAGLAARTGWFNSIAGADFDGDGDIDYVVGNVGLNTKYGHASHKKPAILYRQDMDNNGVFDLVEAKMSAQGELPVRGRSCSSNAMPMLREKFPTYKEFAAASLADIYTDTTLSASDRWEATEFETGLWINESTENEVRLTWQPLPYDAQISPCYGAVAADLFGDGAPALAFAQNLYSREPETGLWRGGLGCVFRPQGSGVRGQRSDGGEEFFRSAPVHHSGFLVAGDGKGLAIADLNGDGLPDLVATQNDDAVLAFQQRAPVEQVSNLSHTNPLVAIRLAGPPGNPTALGARVRLFVGDELRATSEVQGGSGYLSQSTSTVYFRRPASTGARIEVDWPGGRQSKVRLSQGQSTVLVPAP